MKNLGDKREAHRPTTCANPFFRLRPECPSPLEIVTGLCVLDMHLGINIGCVGW